jgi:hypothetical protein
VYLPIRDSIIGLIHPAFTLQHPDLPIAYDNQAFDRDAQPEKFVDLTIDFLEAEQANLGINPRTRIRGVVSITYVCRRGLGARDALATLDWFSSLLKYRSLGSIQMQAPKALPGDTVPGWYSPMLHVPFYADS